MESIGARFQQAREAKGYTLEQVARDTHIAKKFLEALENEDFDIFPGEPYLLGFMRTYSDYVGLPSEETVTLYRNIKLQEQPAPIDELINRKPRGSAGKLIGIVAAVIVVAAVAVILVTSGILSPSPDGVTDADDPVETSQPEPPVGEVFELADEMVEQRFSQGDRILIPVAGELYRVDLASVGDGLRLNVSGTQIDVPVGSEVPLDVDGDGQPDVRVILRSVDTLDSPPTLVMRVDRGASGTQPEPASSRPATTIAADTPAVGSTSEPSRQESARVIAQFEEREEFVVEVRFEGNCLFRYETDDEPRSEQYFQQNQVLRTSVQDRFMLWASNAAAARLRVAGQDIPLGNPGEVTAAMITWREVPDSSNVRLEIIPVY